ncbi:unnamed protein product [Malus baccata var. baccata]
MDTTLRQSPEPDTQTPLLDDVVDGAVDHKGRPVHRSRSGGWRSAWFIIGVEVAETFAYSGICSNLITFLTGPLGQSTAAAAEIVNMWDGTASLVTLLGALVADSFLVRYRTIVFASLLYILVLASPSLSPSPSLYILALSHLTRNPNRSVLRVPNITRTSVSFRPVPFRSICVPNGTSMTLTVLTYIQDNLGWGLGFGIPCIVMVFALLLFLLGTRTYRYSSKGDEESPFVRIGKVFVAALRNWRATPLAVTSEEESRGTLPHESSEQFKFLNKALLAPDNLKENRRVCTIVDVEEQGATMDRTIVSGFDIPAASLQTFISITIVIFVPIYDRIFVPTARAYTRKPSGITMLQRIGTGMLKTAKDYGLLDTPSATVPMSVWWLVPQYLLAGLADFFTMVGLQEFFYDQVPNELRSVGLALYLSIFGVGSFLSSFLISAIDDVTSVEGESSWFSNNLNRAHLDYFYWLLGGIIVVQLLIYLYFAKSYIYKSQAL